MRLSGAGVYISGISAHPPTTAIANQRSGAGRVHDVVLWRQGSESKQAAPDSVAVRGFGASQCSCDPVKVTRPELRIEAASSALRPENCTLTFVPSPVGVSVISMNVGVGVAVSVP